jgi:D-erythro-7,8-dihydroneopterin triphosphate epimerase
MAKIHITDLTLRTIVGTNDWERHKKQDVVINAVMEYDATPAAKSDRLEDTVDYKAMTKKIIDCVEGSRFYLLEKLTDQVLDIMMEDPHVRTATVRIDKPHALRFAKSVSVECSRTRKA